jgi:cytochrome c oxidase assembly factor CtaG/putative copper export protein
VVLRERRDARSVRPWVAAGVLLALIVVVGLSLMAGAAPYGQVGNADPGRVVSLGVPVLRLAADLAATVCVGSLVFAACCTRPQRAGLLAGAAYGEVRLAGAAAVVWCACALLLVPFSVADAGGLPLGTALGNLPGLVSALEQPAAWLLTALLAAVVAVGARLVLRWQPAAVLCGVAVFALLPPLVTAHGSSDTGHDLALAAIVVHVPAAVIWLGVLLAMLRQARRRGSGTVPLFVRYDRLAWWSWLVLAASGLVLGGVLVPAGQLLTAGYGAVLLVKACVVVALGLGGRMLRRGALRVLATDSDGWWRLVRLGGIDAVLLLAVMGISVGLTHLPLPDFLGRALSTTQTLLGYDLAGPPTAARLVLDWRLDVFFGPLAVLLAAGYLLAVRRVRKAEGWPWQRSVAWLAGCAVLLGATSSGIGRYAAAMFSLHLAEHMLLSMLVPALLVLGAPLTLLRAGTGAGGRRLPGLVEVLDRSAGSRLARLGTHPVVALALFAGSPFLLYFTGLFDAAVRFHWAHLLINAWFLVVGYLFFWPLIGLDRSPRMLPNLARLGLLLAAMPADILFGALLIGTRQVIGNGPASSNMYQALALPWVHGLAADQRTAGVIALVLGELALFVALVALVGRWNADGESGLDVYQGIARDLPAHRALAEASQSQAVGHHEQ